MLHSILTFSLMALVLKNKQINQKPIKGLKSKVPANSADKLSKSAPFIVGIGASAGGLQSIEKFLQSLPDKTNQSFIIVQHLSPTHKSYMGEILSRSTKIPVVSVEDNVAIKANTIYISSPNKKIEVRNNTIFLTDLELGPNKKILERPIDFFFKSLSENCKSNCCAIILSGTGTDGTTGIGYVHATFGLTIAEDPKTAKFDGMPSSAISSGNIRLVCNPSEMFQKIEYFCKNKQLPNTNDNDTVSYKPKTLLVPRDEILNEVECTYKVDFSYYKTGTIDRKIERRRVSLGLQSITEYALYIKKNPTEIKILFYDFLVGVTCFFRDHTFFQSIQKHVFPVLIKNYLKNKNDIRIWVAGCATGEEVYSYTIMLLEYLEEHKIKIAKSSIKVFGTDLDDFMLKTASVGKYPKEQLGHVDVNILRKYFDYEDDFYIVKQSIRQMALFSQHNLLYDPPFTKIDLLSCRNLLIYFGKKAQNHFYQTALFSLIPKGFLALGPSEALLDPNKNFISLDSQWKIFEKVTTKKTFLPISGRNTYSHTKSNILHANINSSSFINNSLKTEIAYTKLLSSFVPPSLLIDDELNILHIFGNAGQFLTPQSGTMKSNLHNLLDKRLVLAINLGVQKLSSNETDKDVYEIRENKGKFSSIRIESLCKDEQKLLKTFLVNFISKRPKPSAKRAKKLTAYSLPQEVSSHVTNLESSLSTTKENLQTSIEELRTTNEELQSANEELMSTNEELQSTNEELHSVNEELYIVNSEYQKKVKELDTLQLDEENMIASSKFGAIFLDTDLNIRRCTKNISSCFNILPQDVGRPLEHIAYNLRNPKILNIIFDVQKTKIPDEIEIETKKGEAFLVKISPYISALNKYDGIIMNFINVNAEKDSRIVKEALIDVIPFGVALVDHIGTILNLNAECSKMFGYQSKEKLLGKEIFNLLTDKKNSIAPHHNLHASNAANIFQQLNKSKNIFGIKHDSKTFPLNININLIPSIKEVQYLVSFNDMTHIKHEKLKLEQSNKSLEQFAYAISHDLQAPIRHIAHHVELMKMDLKDSEIEDKKNLQIIEDCAFRARDMISGILTLSRFDHHQIDYTVVDTEDLVKSIIEEFSVDLSKSNYKIETHSLPSLTTDKTLIRQVFTNLISNAIKFSQGVSSPKINITAEKNDKFWEFTIKDNGIGIGNINYDRIFQIFQRSSNARNIEGTGIGLSTCQRIVSRLGGTIRYCPGNPGSQLIFTIPNEAYSISGNEC